MKSKIARRDPDEIPWELPYDKEIIHPSMPLFLGGALIQVCHNYNISVWDRERVYVALKAIQPEVPR